MANPFSLFGMARRATANFRQMSYGTVTAPSTPAATGSSSDNTDAASITSSTSNSNVRRTSSPLIQPARQPSLAVVDNVDVTAAAVPFTSSPSSSPPPLAAAKSVLQGMVGQSSHPDPDPKPNGTAAEPAVFAEEPESMFSDSPKMDPVELDSQVPPGGIDYFSMPPSRPREASDASDSTKVDPDADPNSELDKSTLKRLEAQVSQLLSEKKRLSGDVANLQASHRRLEHELKEKQWAWESDRSALISERDQLTLEKSSLTEQLRELSGEKDRLVHDVGQKQMELDWERVRSEEVGKKLEGVEKTNEGLQARVSVLEATVVEKDRVGERLEGVVASLGAEKQKHLQTISSLEQDLSYAKEAMQTAQAQHATELEAASAENRLLSQQLEDEKAVREAEREQSLKEMSDQEQQFEGARQVLSERVAALVQDVQTKEQDCVKLEEDLVIVKREKEEAVTSLQQELESAKEEAKKQIDSLNAKLSKTKKESESRAQRVAELEKEKAEQCTIM